MENNKEIAIRRAGTDSEGRRMQRLIDADKAIEHIDYVCNAGGWLEPVTTAVNEYVKKHINAEPTVDAIPISWINDWYEKYTYSEVADLLNDWVAERRKTDNEK